MTVADSLRRRLQRAGHERVHAARLVRVQLQRGNLQDDQERRPGAAQQPSAEPWHGQESLAKEAALSLPSPGPAPNE